MTEHPALRPLLRGSVAAVAVVLVLGFLSLVSVTAATAAPRTDPPDWPYPDGGGLCVTDVAGTVPTHEMASSFGIGDKPETNYVIWSGDTGFSIQYACKFKLTGADWLGKAMDRFSVWGQEAHQSVSDCVAYVCTGGLGPHYAGFESPIFDFSPSSGTPGCADGWMEAGHGDPCEFKPLVQTYKRDATNHIIYFRGRLDVLPQQGLTIADVCASGHFCALGYDDGGGGTHPALVYRRMEVAIYPEDGGIGMQSDTPSTYNAPLNDSGAGLPITWPPPEPPGGGGPPGGGEDGCKLLGWKLHGNESGRNWTSDSPEQDLVLTDGETFVLSVRFSGHPPSIRAQVRRNAQTIWQHTLFDPESPAVFTLVGDGHQSQLSVSCYKANGDIDPDGQTTITDEPQHPGESWSDCMDDNTSLVLTSPATWVKALVQGAGCMLSFMFVPKTSLSERWYELKADSKFGRQLGDAFGPVFGALGEIASISPSDCEGPSFVLSGDSFTPMSACEGPIQTAATALRLFLTASVALASAMKSVQIIMNVWLGEPTTVYQAEFNSDVPNGTWV